MTFRCPYCRERGFSAKAKLFVSADGQIACNACGETSRTSTGFLFGGFAYLAFFAGAMVALWMSFQIGPYLSLTAFALFLFGLFALGRVLAPVRRLDAPYRAGFKFGTFCAQLHKRVK